MSAPAPPPNGLLEAFKRDRSRLSYSSFVAFFLLQMLRDRVDDADDEATALLGLWEVQQLVAGA